jgi:E3 ubiquitin-protein ligase SIAH1
MTYFEFDAFQTQCDVGHVVCSPCHDKLKATGKCHVCGVARGSYRRCHDMERLLDSIHVPCPYAPHGCTLRPAYHNQESHRKACVHAPCHCPGESCSFVGSKAALLDHFIAVHSWPCTTTANICADNLGMFTVRLQDGFNFLLADWPTAYRQGATASAQCLLFLIVARQPYARTISVHCIDPHAAATSGAQGSSSNEVRCELRYSDYMLPSSLSGGNQSNNHFQSTTFGVACTDLSNGLPESDDCFQVMVPNSVSGSHDKDGIEGTVRIKLIGAC